MKAITLIEQIIIGAMANGLHPAEIGTILTPEMMSTKDHRRIFETINDLDEEGAGISYRTIAARLGTMAGGEDPVAYISACIRARLKDDVFSIPNYCSAITEAYVTRRLADTLEINAKKIKAGRPAAEIIPDMESSLSELTAIKFGNDHETMTTAAEEAIDEMAKAYQGKGLEGIGWGFHALDRAAGGPMEYGNFMGLLFDSGAGKTSISLQILRQAAEAGHPVMFISFEQNRKQCLRQMASQKLAIEARRMRHGEFSTEEFERIDAEIKAIAQLPLEVEKAANWTWKEIATAMKRFRRQRGRGLVVIDHAKSINLGKTAMFAEAINEVYQRIRDGAQVTGHSTLMLMQRKSESMFRRDPAPIKRDAYGGDATHESLDLLIGMWRPEQVYRIKKTQAKNKQEMEECDVKILQWELKAEIIALKNRYGEEGMKAEMMWEPHFTRFRDTTSAIANAQADPRFVF